MYDMDSKFVNVDMFAGGAEISQAFARKGLRSCALDVSYSDGDATQSKT